MARSLAGSWTPYTNNASATTIPLGTRNGVSAGAFLTAEFRCEDNSPDLTVSDNVGGTWTAYKKATTTGNTVCGWIAYSWNHPGGNVSITGTLTISSPYRRGYAQEWQGGDSSDPFISGSLQDSIATLNLNVPITPPCMVLGLQVNYNSGTITPSSPAVDLGGDALSRVSYIGGLTTGTTRNIANTGGSGSVASLAMAFADPGGGGATNYTLTCDVGSYSLTGIAALLRRGYSLVASVGSYALTGQDAALRRGYSLAANVGSYALTGQDAALRRGYSLVCDVGSYSLTGYDATLTYSAGGTAYTLTCDAGSYGLTGYDAILTYTPGAANYSLAADAGTYTLAGNAALLSLGRRLVADAGAYSVTGQTANLIYGRRLVCEPGAYTLTGSDADLVYTTTGPIAYSLTCETGAYVLSGLSAGLIYTDGSAPTGSPHGFVITDTAPRLWWQRKPKALDEQEAEQKVAKVIRVVERIARQQVEAETPAPAKEQKREVREAIAPLVAEMPGFDWMTLYRTILIELGRRQQEQQAAEMAQMEIARIQTMRRDEDDVLILLMSI